MQTPDVVSESVQIDLAGFILIAGTMEREDFALRDRLKILDVVKKMTPQQVVELLVIGTMPAGRGNIISYNPTRAKELVQAYKVIALATI